MRVAYFTPLQPVKSGISDYNEDLIPALVEAGVELDFFYENEKPDNPFIVKNCRSHKHTEFPALYKNGKYDLTVYHIGNHRFHDYIYEYLFDYPGVLVLHDFFLHHARLAKYVETGNLNGYIEEMKPEGNERIARIIAAGMGGELLYYLFPLNRRVIGASKHIIMHNTFFLNRITQDYPGKGVSFIPHNAKPRRIPKSKVREIRRKAGIPEDAVVIASFGFMNEAKKIGLISQVLGRLLPEFDNLYYLICGEDKEGVVRGSYFNFPVIRDRVKVSGYISGLEEFTAYMEASDIVINLRFPSAGETSGTMIRSMAQGKPVIVYDLPTLTDTPAEALVRVPLTNEFNGLYTSLQKLVSNPSERIRIGSNARAYVKQELDLKRNAALYKEAFQNAISH
ncbi:MAG: glycosyltransferase [Acidobacteria bacterium]|nr:glycosyltransferase [Acidobacteriota bacterium]